MNAFIDEHRARCGVEPICSALQVAPSVCRRHAARKRHPALLSQRAKRDALLLPEVQRVFDQNLQVYGADKVWRQLLREGMAVARCTVERLMRSAGLRGARRGKSVRTTVPDAKAPCPLDRVNRQFQADRPNSIRYSERLAEAGIEPSVGSTGDSYDNALAETINGLFKAEIIHRRGPWKTREAVELATLEWVSWFNNKRLLEPIGYIPPAEAKANYWKQQAQASSTTKRVPEAAQQEG